MLAQCEGDEKEMRKYKSITDGPHAAEMLDALKKRIYETRNKVLIAACLYIRRLSNGYTELVNRYHVESVLRILRYNCHAIMWS